MRFILKAFAVVIATAAYSQDGLARAATAVASVEESEVAEDFPEDMDLMSSMSMSMSMPYERFDDGLDCSALQQRWKTDPRSIEGSDLMLVKQYCDEGLISTAAEVSEVIEAFEGPDNPTVDEQLALLADQACEDSSNVNDEDLDEVHAACGEDPRDNEKVVDVLARLANKGSPEAGNLRCYALC